MIDLEKIDIGDKLKDKKQIDDTTRKTRYQHCQECEKLTPRYFCSVCGCFMPIKARLPFTKCPLKKW